jgi:hypothetical protein
MKRLRRHRKSVAIEVGKKKREEEEKFSFIKIDSFTSCSCWKEEEKITKAFRENSEWISRGKNYIFKKALKRVLTPRQ